MAVAASSPSKRLNEQELQIDHRVPYEVAGEASDLGPDNFMLLCGSANRAKSWSCEHCENWLERKDKGICVSCYWASPENYSHIAMRQIRRVDLIWQGNEVSQYERLKEEAASYGTPIPKFVKKVSEDAMKKR